MHGGAPGSGAPRGNQNAFKHGVYTREALEERRSVQDLLRQSRMLGAVSSLATPLSFLQLSLSRPYPWTAAVLVDEFDTRGFQGSI